MRLLTHNLILCGANECEQGFPLTIKIQSTDDVQHTDDNNYSPEMTRKILERLDWNLLREASSSISKDLPLSYTEEDLVDENFLKLVYDTVFNIHIVTGNLMCPHCSRLYPIKNGIPNLLIREKI